MSELEHRIGYFFADKALLTRALTHTSTAKDSYERMEFLGDRILSFIVAEMLYHAFPQEDEGALAKRLSALVKQGTLADIAAQLEMSSHVQMSGHESRVTESILSDVVESLIAALYLDGGFTVAEKFIRRFWRDRLHKAVTPPEDAKSRLQEWAQGKAIPLPEYKIVERSGPDHAPLFTVEVSVAGQNSQRANGASKQIAEKEAARKMLEAIGKA